MSESSKPDDSATEPKEPLPPEAAPSVDPVAELLGPVLETQPTTPPGKSRLWRVEVSGPVPLPQLLKQYDEIVPGSAKRMMDQAEKQTAHRQRQETKALDSNIKNSNWGTRFGFVLGIVALIGGLILIDRGHDNAGLGVIALVDGSLALAFVTGTYSNRAEREAKAKERLKPKGS